MSVIFKFQKNIKNIIYRIQRFKRGYSDKDVWNIDMWFLNIMPKILTEYKNNLHSCPMEFYDNKNCSTKKWEKLIERMIFLLQEMNEETCSYKNKYEEEFLALFDNKDYNYIVQSDSDLQNKYYGEEKNKNNYMNNCKKEFFELFSKYFYDLWD